MHTKSRLLLPAGVLAAAILGTACGPPPPPPPPPTTTTLAPPPGNAASAAATSAKAGPDGVDPIASWGVDGTATATAAIIGNVVYVGGTFNNTISPTGVNVARTNLAAFCLADGALLNTFTANFAGGPVNALTTDGTSLFVGGNFTTLNGVATNRIVKLNAASGARDASFAPLPIPATAAVPPVTDGVLALAYSSTGVLYAGGDFNKIGTGAGMGQSTVVGNAAGFSANGALTSFTGDADKKVESIAVSPDGSTVFMGGFFNNVKASARGQLAKIDVATNTLGGTNLAIGAHVLDIVATSNNDVTLAVGTAITPNMGRRLATFAGNTAGLNDILPKGDVNAVEVVGGLDFFGMSKGYGTNSGPNLVGVDPTQGVGTANYMPFASTGAGVLGVLDLAQGANGRFVAVGDFTSMGATPNLHGLAIFA